MSGLSDISELLDESLKMKTFSHPNILSLIGVCVDAGPAPYVVMPYMEKGSLLQYLKKERPHFTIAEGADSELVSFIPDLIPRLIPFLGHHSIQCYSVFGSLPWFQHEVACSSMLYRPFVSVHICNRCFTRIES